MQQQNQELQALIEPVRGALEQFRANTIQESTRQSYLKKARYLWSLVDDEGKTCLHDVICSPGSKNTYFGRLAALRYIVMEEIDKQLRVASNNSGDADAFFNVTCQLRYWIDRWFCLESYRGQSHLVEVHKRKSQQQSLRGLPADWRDRVCFEMRRSKYWVPALVLAATGCRPKELVLGVEIEMLETKKMQTVLAILIKGAKTSEKQGQPKRMLIHRRNCRSHVLSNLFALVKENGGYLKVDIENGKNMTMAIMRVAKKLWPRHPKNVTAYSFRHQFAADCKATMPAGDVARAQGHISALTQKRYGRKQQSHESSRIAPDCVYAVREVLHESKLAYRSVVVAKEKTHIQPDANL